MLALKFLHGVVSGVSGLVHVAVMIRSCRKPLRPWRYAWVPVLFVSAWILVKCAGPGGGLPGRLEAQLACPPRAVQPPGAHAELLRRAREDPIGLLEEALGMSAQRLGSYEGIFVIQERIDGRLRSPLTSRFKFRSRPFSVAMRRIGGKSGITRLLYVEGRNGGKMIVRPRGLLGKLTAAVEVDPRGPLARRGSLRTVTDFGLENALKRILTAYRRAAARNQLDSECLGVGELDGGRILTLKKGAPDGETIVELDVETLLPVRVRRYTQGRRLLAYYHYKDLNFDRDLTDTDFSREANGLSARKKPKD